MPGLTSGSWRDTLPAVRRNPVLSHEGSVLALGVSGDARVLASAGADGWLRMCNLQRGVAGYAVDLGERPTDLAVGASLTAVGAGRKARLFNTLAGVEVGQIRAREAVTALALSGDGVLLAIGDVAGGVRIHRAVTGRCVARWRSQDAVTGLCFGPDDEIIGVVSGGRASWYRLESRRPELLATRPSAATPCWRRTQARAGHWWWTDEEGLWCANRTLDESSVQRVGDTATSLCMDATGRHLVALRGDVLWQPDRDDGLMGVKLSGPLALHPSGLCLAHGDGEGHVMWWRLHPWGRLPEATPSA